LFKATQAALKAKAFPAGSIVTNLLDAGIGSSAEKPMATGITSCGMQEAVTGD
jgi:hypothetical protein